MGVLARIFRARPEDQLRGVLGDFKLPSFPAVILKARTIIRDESASNADIGGCIVQDPGLSVRVLKTVNAAAYGMRHRVDSVDQAVALLGRAQVESLLLAHGVGAVLPKMRGRESARFWGAAARRAAVAQGLAQRLHPATAAQSFTASLLQDMAVPVLTHVLRDRYNDVFASSADEGGADLADLERAEFGWDHADVGAWMCEAWSFPETLTACIADHHAGYGPDLNAPAAVRAVAVLPDIAAAGDVNALVAFVEKEHDVDADEIRAIVETADSESADLARLFQ